MVSFAVCFNSGMGNLVFLGIGVAVHFTTDAALATTTIIAQADCCTRPRAMKTLIGTVILCAIHLSSQEHSCPTNPTGFTGEEFVINCNFEADFEGVFWFDETDSSAPLITLEDGKKNGRGSKTNEFDILQNGALVIKHVQSKHEQRYHVRLLDSSLQDYTFYVNVSVMEYGCPVTARGFYGSEAMINCRLGANLSHLFWFGNVNGNDFLISLVSGVKGGPGYLEKEYDVMENGSLVIKNVSFQHEHNYEASLVTSENHEQFDVSFSVIEHCPPHQKGFIGEIAYIVCHFKPDFNEVTWFDDSSSGQPLITRRGSEVYRPGNDKYTVTTNGSLLIPRVSDEHSNTYTVTLRDADNNNSTHYVNFDTESSCNVTSPPDNGHFTHIRKTVTLAGVGCNKGYSLYVSNYSVCKNGPEIADDPLFGSSPVCISDNVTPKESCGITSPPYNGYVSHVRKTITLAKVICNKGYHISVSNYSVCLDDQEIESDELFGSSPMCIPDDVTSTRPTLPSDPTKMSLITPTYKQNDDMGGCVAHEWCKNCKIVLIIASVFFPLLVALNAVAILKLHFRKNNAQSGKHKSTEEEHKLRTEPGESSL